MDRSRAAAPPLSAEEAPFLPSVWDVPDAGHSTAAPLSERLEALRSEGTSQANVSAFVEGLALPVGPGETPRHRADLLLDVLEDEFLCGRTTDKDVPVGPAVLEALQALGFPYALEVTPTMLAAARQSAKRAPWGADTRWGVGAALLSTLSMVPRYGIDLDVRLCFSALLVAFALGAVLFRNMNIRVLHRLFNVLHGLTGGVLFLMAGLLFMGRPPMMLGFLPLGCGLLSLSSTWLLRRGPPH